MKGRLYKKAGHMLHKAVHYVVLNGGFHLEILHHLQVNGAPCGVRIFFRVVQFYVCCVREGSNLWEDTSKKV